MLLDPCSLFQSPSTFVPAWFVAQGCVHVEVCRNGIVTILPFIISNNNHRHGRAHSPDVYKYTYILKNQQKRKSEAITRKLPLCAEKNKRPGEKRLPNPCSHQAARTKSNKKKNPPHSPAPYSSRSAVSPVKVPLAMVLIWLLHKPLHRQTTA
jgi:hypothetical protein